MKPSGTVVYWPKTMPFSLRSLKTAAQLTALFGAAFGPRLVFAYEHPLSDDEVQQAYSIGQDAFKVNSFFAQYTQAPAPPAGGLQIAQIGLSTPFAQAVQVSAERTQGFTAGDAVDDYHKRGDSIIVNLKTLLTPTYSTSDVDFWRTISVGLIQNGRHMAATKVAGQPIYSADSVGDSELVGANVQIQFSVHGVGNGPVVVEIVPPAGPWVHATFDLSSLK